jgi:serine protease
MLDAGAAVAAVSGPVARIDVTPALPVAGTAVQLSGSASSVAAGRNVTTWEWTLVDGGGIATAFSSATNASTAALTPSAAGSLVVRLTVTDDLGARASINQTIAVTAPAPPVVAPPAATGGGGGGGAVTLPWMLLLALATALLWRAPPGPVKGRVRRA